MDKSTIDLGLNIKDFQDKVLEAKSELFDLSKISASTNPLGTATSPLTTAFGEDINDPSRKRKKRSSLNRSRKNSRHANYQELEKESEKANKRLSEFNKTFKEAVSATGQRAMSASTDALRESCYKLRNELGPLCDTLIRVGTIITGIVSPLVSPIKQALRSSISSITTGQSKCSSKKSFSTDEDLDIDDRSSNGFDKLKATLKALDSGFIKSKKSVKDLGKTTDTSLTSKHAKALVKESKKYEFQITAVGKSIGFLKTTACTGFKMIGMAATAAFSIAGAAIAGVLAGVVAGFATAMAAAKAEIDKATVMRESAIDIKKQLTLANRELLILGPSNDVRQKYLDLAIAVEDLRWENRYMTDDTKKAEKAWAEFISVFSALKNTLGDIVTKGFAMMAPSLQSFADSVVQYAVPAIATITTAFTNWKDCVDTVTGGIMYGLKYVVEFMCHIFENATKIIVEFFKNYPTIVLTNQKNVITILGNLGTAILGILEDLGIQIWKLLPNSWQDAFSDVRTIFDNFLNNCSEWGGVVVNWLSDWGKSISTELSNIPQYFTNLWINIKVAFGKGMDVLGNLWDGMMDMFKKYGGYLMKLFNNIGANIKNFWEACKNYVTSGEWNFKATGLTDGFDSISDSVKKAAEERQGKKKAKKDEDAKKNIADGKNADGSVAWDFNTKHHDGKTFSELSEGVNYKNLYDGIATDEERDKKRKERDKEREEARSKRWNLLEGVDTSGYKEAFANMPAFEESESLKKAGEELQKSADKLHEGYTANKDNTTSLLGGRMQEQRDKLNGKVRPMSTADMIKLLQSQSQSSTESLESAYERMNNSVGNDRTTELNLLKKIAESGEKKAENDKKSNEEANKSLAESTTNTKDTADYTKAIYSILNQKLYGDKGSQAVFAEG